MQFYLRSVVCLSWANALRQPGFMSQLDLGDVGAQGDSNVRHHLFAQSLIGCLHAVGNSGIDACRDCDAPDAGDRPLVPPVG